MCSINVRSINNKSLCIHDYIITNDLDLLFLCETWLGTDYDEQSISQMLPPGYKILHHPRVYSRGGGVAIVFKQNIDIVKLDCSDASRNLEYINCRAQINKKQFVLCCVYKPPSSSNSDFISEWNNLLSSLVIYPGEIIICGDVNIHLDKPSNSNTNTFLQSLHACGLVQHVQEATHYLGHTPDIIVTRESNNCINNIHVTDPMLCNEDNVLIRDHYAITAMLNIEKPAIISKKVKYRNIRNIVLDDFKDDIADSAILNDCARPLYTR